MYLIKKMKSIFTIILFISCLSLQAQTELNNTISNIFGGLPFNKPTNEIIEYVEKNKNFKGNSHYNLCLSYSGIVKKNNFFELKPKTFFIEIISDKAEVELDSIYNRKSSFSISACYKGEDSLLILKEYKRVVEIISATFKNNGIESQISEHNVIQFFKNKNDVIPIISVSFQKEGCLTGNYCINITYIR